MHGQGDLLVFWKQRWEGPPWRTETAHNVLCKRMGDRNPGVSPGLATLRRPLQPLGDIHTISHSGTTAGSGTPCIQHQETPPFSLTHPGFVENSEVAKSNQGNGNSSY